MIKVSIIFLSLLHSAKKNRELRKHLIVITNIVHKTVCKFVRIINSNWGNSPIDHQKDKLKAKKIVRWESYL
jgi:hypothetical protein